MCAVFLVCDLHSYLTLRFRQMLVPGELLQPVTHTAQDICEFQLIKHHLLCLTLIQSQWLCLMFAFG